MTIVVTQTENNMLFVTRKEIMIFMAHAKFSSKNVLRNSDNDIGV
jgi:hypothetical protein